MNLKALLRPSLAITTALLMTTLALTATQAQGKTPTQERASLELLLKGYDRVATAEQLQSAAVDPQAILLTIQADPKAPLILRLQAIDAMGRLPDARTRQKLRELLAEAPLLTTAPRRTHRAINALMEADGTKAQDEILQLLTHPDLQVRITVAYAVVRFGDKTGKNRLVDHLTHEKNPIVREEIARLVPTLR